MKAIETKYKGYRFRSRLEARWAVFFDALGIEWRYEPEGFDLGFGAMYLPDFWLPIQKQVCGVPGCGHWIEIKATEPTPDAIRKMRLLVLASGHTGKIFSGDPYKYTETTIHRANSRFPEGFIKVREYDALTCGDVIEHWAFRALSYYRNEHFEDDGMPNYAWMEKNRVIGCFQKSRSARFEHGESGVR